MSTAEDHTHARCVAPWASVHSMCTARLVHAIARPSMRADVSGWRAHARTLMGSFGVTTGSLSVSSSASVRVTGFGRIRTSVMRRSRNACRSAPRSVGSIPSPQNNPSRTHVRISVYAGPIPTSCVTIVRVSSGAAANQSPALTPRSGPWWMKKIWAAATRQVVAAVNRMNPCPKSHAACPPSSEPNSA